jgi:hypothetical protein
VKPEDLVSAGFWKALESSRNRGTKRSRGWEPLRRALEPFSSIR